MLTEYARPDFAEVQRRRRSTYVSPLHRPSAWECEDWDAHCDECHKPIFMAAKAERMLPSGAIEVLRCRGCSRALWYRSESTPDMVKTVVNVIRWGERRRW